MYKGTRKHKSKASGTMLKHKSHSSCSNYTKKGSQNRCKSHDFSKSYNYNTGSHNRSVSGPRKRKNKAVDSSLKQSQTICFQPGMNALQNSTYNASFAQGINGTFSNGIPPQSSAPKNKNHNRSTSRHSKNA